MTRRFFDLNIQRVLEHWTVSEGVREIIANALDEQRLTGTREPEIFPDDDGNWHIRDYGRGLQYEHLTQNEDDEKLANPEVVIGKFGVGLKDALATFDRHNIRIAIHSKHSDITVESVSKHGFEEVLTLHAVVDPPSHSNLAGTDFVLSGLAKEDVDRAKDFFLRYSGDSELERTRYGSVLQRGESAARIYVNGLRVAEEPNFLFSYDITSLTKALRRALNRERSNVGRQAYSDRVKSILLACSSAEVARPLASDLERFATGTNHDETAWLDVSLQACKLLNAQERVVFATPSQMYSNTWLLEHAEADGYRIAVVPENVAHKLPDLQDITGNAIRDLHEYTDEWHRSFEYQFVPIERLTDAERTVFETAGPVLALVRTEAALVREVLISETMRMGALDSGIDGEVVGVWEAEENRIIIQRGQLGTAQTFLATLLHEVGHALSGAPDVTREFEAALTHLLGATGAAASAPASPSPL